MNIEGTESDSSSRLTELLAAMWALRVTLFSLGALAFGVHAVRWLAGPKPAAKKAVQPPSEDPKTNSEAVKEEADRPINPAAISESQKDESDIHAREPSSLRQDSTPNNDTPRAGEGLKGEMAESSGRESPVPLEPETPKRLKTRVKRIRFEQPDSNGHYSDHFQLANSQDPEKLMGSPNHAADAPPSPQTSDSDSTGTQKVMKSPYSDNTTEWGLPPFASDRSLGRISEEPDRLSSCNGHSRGHSKNPSISASFGDESFDDDPTPFSTQDLVSAPTEAGYVVNDEYVGNVLAEVGEQVPPRRHSRSFSEPNLAGMLSKQSGLSQISNDPELQHALRTGLGEDESSDASPDYFAAQNAQMNQAQDHSDERGQEGNGEAKHLLNSFEEARNSNGKEEAHPLLRLEIITGPSRGRFFTVDPRTLLVKIGRLPENEVHFEDNEVSSHHAELEWCSKRKCWLVRDMGSLNGTRLNGNFISNAIRRPGKTWKLNSDDILLLGHRTSIKVAYLPNTDLPSINSNNKLKLYAPPSGLQPCVTMKSEAIASLRAELGIEKTLQEKSLRMDVACVSHVGAEHKRRGQACEDMPFLGESGRTGAALYCVFDGHCGSNSSKQCVSILPECLRKRMPDIKSALKKSQGLGPMWEEVFLETDASLKTEDGTTATAVLVWKDANDAICIQAANVGDSAAVLWRQNEPTSKSEQLTTDHRISSPEERKRLKSIGIELTEGANRLYGLNVARCLGDHYLKEFGFSAVPSVSRVVKLLPHESALLIIASDGLWDVAEPSKVIEVAKAAQQRPESSTESIAQTVYQLAVDKRSRDDITAIVLSFSAEELSKDP